ncbi:MAG: NADH-quinone oxidoreductase subunit L [Verrucomicrobiota bacterium]
MFDQIEEYIWLALFMPLLAAAAITLFTRRNGRLSAFLSIGAVGVAFLISVFVYVAVPMPEAGQPPVPVRLAKSWINVPPLQIDFSLGLDSLSMLMLLIVTGVGGAIHVYSYGYMRQDAGLSRYFACLSLFTFSMLGIVLADNFLFMFIFWELVGVSSYLLIGFWYERPSAADAAKKAFITNRLGDLGFLLGILLIWTVLGSLNFFDLAGKLNKNPQALGVYATLAGLLIFCGAMGKSAQFPLHVWLPDAMEGPTPVSALIHAATMVAAGVYMLCRVFFLFTAAQAWPESLAFLNGITALEVIAWIGGITAFLAAVIAIQQNDIKRILAYSTLSQLGYMVMAVGLSGATPAMYHLTTHAFFKALLFLGAGSVIHGLHHEQDIWQMGNLKSKMPITFWTFLLATLALCGVPPFSGFFSKDAILAAAYEHNILLFGLGVLVAVLTTFYMFRLVFVAFLGPAKSPAPDHAHESPLVMTIPLMLLAVPTVLSGFWGIDTAYGRQLGGVHAEHSGSFVSHLTGAFGHSPAAAIFGLFAVLFGITMAAGLYWNAANDPLPEKLGALSRTMRNRFYFDEIYEKLIAITHEAISYLANAIDQWIIAGLMVKGLHGGTDLFGRALRLVQTGNLQTYAFLFVAGVAVILFFVLGFK